MSVVRIEEGDRGPLVVALQVMLNRFVQHQMLSVDGRFGGLTKEGVLQVQTLMGAATNGTVDTPMWRELCSRAQLLAVSANDIYDSRHDSATPPEARGRGWIASGGMSGGVEQVVEEIRRTVPRRGSLVLLRFYGHGGPGVQGVTGGTNTAQDWMGRSVCEVNHAGQQLTGYIIRSEESPTGETVCAVRLSSGTTQYFGREHFNTISMSGVDNHAAIAAANLQAIGGALGRLKPLFAAFGSVELHGCKVGRGAPGRRFLARLAAIFEVPVTGAIESQSFGLTSAQRFEGAVHTAYPGNVRLGAWAAQFRS